MTTEPCRDPLRDDLVAHLDGELPPAAEAAVAAHLEACGACAGERDALLASWQALDELAPIDARPGWLEEVEAAARASERGRLLRLWPASLAVVAAAAALLLAVGIAWLTPAAPEGPAIARDAEAPDLGEQPDSLEHAPPTERSEVEAVDGEAEVAELEEAELAALPPEELEVVRNLELLVMLEEGQDLDVLETLDLLEQLGEDELDES